MKFPAGALIAIAGFMAVFASPSAAGPQPALEPGMWRITVTTTTNGKADPAQDVKECLGEELKDLPAYFAPQLEGGEAECTRTRQPSEDRKVAYRMQCRGAGFTVDALTGVTVENSRHFTATMRINSQAEQESALVVGKAEGRRTGACPAK
jgi:hypothetical protein